MRAGYPGRMSPTTGNGGISAAKLGNPIAWYDFSNAGSLTLVSSAITQALDRSGNGNHTDVQGTTTSRPTWSAAQLNGLPTATFDGGDLLILPSTLYSVPNGPNTVFSIAKKNTEDGNTQIVVWAGNTGTQWGSFYSANTGTVSYRQTGTLDNTGNTNTNYQLLEGDYNGIATINNRVNGGTATTAGTGIVKSDISTMAIGARTPNLLFLTGGIGEIIIYNRQLSAAEISLVSAYLANKWGVYVPGVAWIGAYNSWKQMLINAWKINKDDAFTNTAANPFAAIYDPSTTALGATTSLTDSGRGINTATEATNPPINTIAAIGTANGLLYNATNTLLNAGSDSSIDNLYAAGGSIIAVIKPTSAGGGNQGRIVDKNGQALLLSNVSGSACSLRVFQVFSVTNGDWRTTNPDVTFGSVSIIASTYDNSNVSNNPSLYVNSLTAKAITQTLIPTLTPTSDASSTMYIGDSGGALRVFDGYFGKILLMKSIPTLAQRTSVFNFLATEYGVTLS